MKSGMAGGGATGGTTGLFTGKPGSAGCHTPSAVQTLETAANVDQSNKIHGSRTFSKSNCNYSCRKVQKRILERRQGGARLHFQRQPNGRSLKDFAPLLNLALKN